MFKINALKKCTAIIAFFLMLVNQASRADAMPETEVTVPLLVLDEDAGLTLPKRFRTSTDDFKINDSVSKKGLESLQAAASGQFSKTTLENALKKIDGPVWIIDLRKETHGFVDGLPISWYSPGNQSNIGESDDNIMRMEQMMFKDVNRQGAILVSQILKKKNGNIIKSHQVDLKVKSAQTESSLVGRLNLGYLRMGVLDHHRPSDATVDHFVEFVKTLPSEAWLYFHCRGGKGRSTTFMAMYDMIKNAQAVSLDDIIQRQALLGGADLFQLSEDEEDLWKKEDLEERKVFITKFYQYAKDSRGLPKKTWSEWIKNNK